MARMVVKTVITGTPSPISWAKCCQSSNVQRALSLGVFESGGRGWAGFGVRCIADKAGIVDSPFKNSKIPEETLPKYIWKGMDNNADKPAITCGVTGRSYTYAEARDSTLRFAWALLTTGQLQKGDVVGILLPNLPEYPAVIHGAIEAGLVTTFVNPLYTADEVTRQFTNAGVKCCITIPQLLSVVSEVSPKLSDYKSTIVIGQEEHDPANSSLSYELLLKDATPVTLPRLQVDDVAVLPYSSGTTGLPKGVMLTHRNLVVNLEQTHHPDIEDFVQTTKEKQTERCLTVLPFFHIYGFNGILNVSMVHGLHLLAIPRFVPEDYIACLVKYKPTVLFAVPSLLLFLASHPAVTREHLSSVDKVICGAAPATKSLIDKFKAKLGNRDVNIRQGYGMTESSPVTMFPPVKVPVSKLASCGQVVPHTQARIVDIETQANLGPDQSGELLIRGPQVMKGYLKNEEATKETVDDDGWLHTGDVAYYDEEQYFYIVDRTKELIKVKGNQVSVETQ